MMYWLKPRVLSVGSANAADPRLIAAAVNALPALLDRLEQAEDMNEALREHADAQVLFVSQLQDARIEAEDKLAQAEARNALLERVAEAGQNFVTLESSRNKDALEEALCNLDGPDPVTALPPKCLHEQLTYGIGLDGVVTESLCLDCGHKSALPPKAQP